MSSEEAVKAIKSHCYFANLVPAGKEALDMAIEALEQEPCEDAISRADAVKVASGYCHPANVAKELAKLPPVIPKKRWIPVSERLPENFQRVLITIVNYNGDKVVRVAEFHIHSWNKIFQVKENYEQWEVGEKGLLAWKPLPEPYEPQESENKE